MTRAVATLPAPQHVALVRGRTVRVALAGCGVVSSACVQLLQSRAHGFVWKRQRIGLALRDMPSPGARSVPA